MPNRNLNLSILILLFLPAASATANNGAELFPADTIPQSLGTEKLERIGETLTYSPHYKNRNAAGRIVIFNRNAPVVQETRSRVNLTGPAYKNRRMGAKAVGRKKVWVRYPRRLSGPRYKNRGAKAHLPRYSRFF